MRAQFQNTMDADNLKKEFRDLVSRSYRENFQRDITDSEMDEVFKYLIPRMEDELKMVKGFSDVEFKRYMNSKKNALTFSPMNIRSEINRVLVEDGEGALTKYEKYKRLREMEVATRLCFANYKRRGEMFMISPQDNPDIILALMGSHTKIIPAVRLEVMTIPEIVKGRFVNNLPKAIADFIQEKKFNKDYGGECSLIVCLNFTQIALDLSEIAKAIQEAKNNPYSAIWLTFASSEDGKTMTVIQVFPGFVSETYNLESERNLLY